MTALANGITDVQPLRKRSVMMVATAALAVAGFVGVSLALGSLATLALTGLGLVEDSYGQCAQYILTTGLSMYVVRAGFDALGIRYSGTMIVSFFLAISLLVMAFALSSGFMRVDFAISLLQMSALCLFAYLQFAARDGRCGTDSPG